MTDFGRTLSYVITAVIAIAIIAVVLSNKAQTVQVIQAAASGLGNLLGTVVQPVVGTPSNTTGSGLSPAGLQLGGGTPTID